MQLATYFVGSLQLDRKSIFGHVHIVTATAKMQTRHVPIMLLKLPTYDALEHFPKF